MLRKVALIVIATLAKDSLLQLHYAVAILVLILYMQEHWKPFHEDSSILIDTRTTAAGNVAPAPGSAAAVKTVDADARKRHSRNLYLLHTSEVSSLILCIGIVWVAAFVSVSPCRDYEWICSGMSVVMIGSNAAFAMFVSVTFVKFFAKRHLKNGEKLANGIEMVRSKFSNLSSTNPASKRSELGSESRGGESKNVVPEDGLGPQVMINPLFPQQAGV